MVESGEDEVDELDLDDGAHAADGGADGGAGEPRFGERGVEDAVGPELVEEPVGDAEDAAGFHILAEEDDAVVVAHDLAMGALDGFGDGCLRHGGG